jgi:hypothetical protein
MRQTIELTSFECDLIRVDILHAIEGFKRDRELALCRPNKRGADVLQAAIDVREDFLERLNVIFPLTV